MELLELLRARNSPIAVLIISAFASEQLAQEALSLGAGAVLAKPFSLDAFRAAMVKIVPSTAPAP